MTYTHAQTDQIANTPFSHITLFPFVFFETAQRSTAQRGRDYEGRSFVVYIYSFGDEMNCSFPRLVA
jgi:hypothetical protein